MLNRVRAWLETHQVENNGLLKNIRDSLSDYEAKLQELRAVLQDSAAQTKRATGLNRENEGALGAIQVSHRQKKGTGRQACALQTLIKQERGVKWKTSHFASLLPEDSESADRESLPAAGGRQRNDIADWMRDSSCDIQCVSINIVLDIIIITNIGN